MTTTTPSIAVDGVEIKFTVARAGLDGALASYGLRGGDAKKRDVFLFDELDIATGFPRLLAAAIVLRLRRKKDGSGTTTLKLRPADGYRLTGDFAAGSEAFADYTVEVDWSSRQVLAASMNADVDEGPVAAVLNVGEPIRGLFSPDQFRLLDEAGSPPPDAFGLLRTAGPITTHRWDDVAGGELAGLRAERWTYLDNAFLELSMRADDLDEAEQLRTVLRKDIDDRGIELDPSTTSKTETALRDFLSAGG